MVIADMKYYLREARWRTKEGVRAALARVNRHTHSLGASHEPQSEIGYSYRHLTPAGDQLLLREYDPHAMVKVPVTEVVRARFPVIDVHCHLNDGIVMRKTLHPSRFISVMDDTNVKSAINLTGGWGEKLLSSLRSLGESFPGRFYVFCQIDYSRLDEPNYLVETLEEAHAAGAKGVKVLKDLGLTVRDRHGKRVRIDDPRLDCVWERAGKLGMPVGIHAADPDAFFARMDRHNERYQELIVHPDWGYFGKGFPTKAELLAERNQLFERHPGTSFWGLHMANHSEDLDEVTEWMEKYSNLRVELGGRIAELGRQPRRAGRFIRQFQDRVMFGMDTHLSTECYRTYFRFLETEDDCFEYPGYPWQGAWKIYGLGLSDDVLKKLYHENAARELGLPLLGMTDSLSAQ